MKSQRTAIEANHPDVVRLLKIRPGWRQLLRLSRRDCIWTVLSNSIRRKAKKENPPGAFCLAHAQLLALCRFDRKYIDLALEHVHFDTQCPDLKPWIQSNFSIGLTLCDLGYYFDGISYIEKAIALETRPDELTRMKMWLCFRLNVQVNSEKLLKIAEALANEKPEDKAIKAVLAKAYTDAGRFDEAEDIITAIVEEYPRDYGFLLAGLHFARKDFQAAGRTFNQYRIPQILDFWLPEYDYKKALTYYYCNQQDKWIAQALRIRRRMKWDKFYRLAIDKASIERVPDIYQMIQSDQVDNNLFNADKISHYCKNILYIIRLYLKDHWGIILFWIVFTSTLFILVCNN